jgi:hypothetical protein
MLVGERGLKPEYRLDLDVAEVVLPGERRHLPQTLAHHGLLGHPLEQGHRAMEMEDTARADYGIEPAQEQRLASGRQVVERERRAPGSDALLLRCLLEALDVLVRLPLDRPQRRPRLLRLNRRDRLAVNVEEVVDWPVGGLELTHGDTAARGQVDVAGALHGPAGGVEHAVDEDASFLLGGENGLRHKPNLAG